MPVDVVPGPCAHVGKARRLELEEAGRRFIDIRGGCPEEGQGAVWGIDERRNGDGRRKRCRKKAGIDAIADVGVEHLEDDIHIYRLWFDGDAREDKRQDEDTGARRRARRARRAWRGG